jgi:hypothetical protein
MAMHISRKISVWLIALFLLSYTMLYPNAVSAQFKSGLDITVDLTNSGIRFVEKVPGNYTAAPGTVQVLNNQYYIVPNKGQIVNYGSKYYVTPSTAKFNRDKYGHFCGSDWGITSGNEKYGPINDGGLDAACRQHDIAWRNRTIASGDSKFLSALYGIKPKWAYEEVYVKKAIDWMKCRLQNNIVTAGPEPICWPKPAFEALNPLTSHPK